MKKLLNVLVAFTLCCGAMALAGCNGSMGGTNNDPSFPMSEKIIGTWEDAENDLGYAFYADGTGTLSGVGTMTYTLEFEEEGLAEYPQMSGWILTVALDGGAFGWIYTVSISDDTLVLVSTDGTKITCART